MLMGTGFMENILLSFLSRTLSSFRRPHFAPSPSSKIMMNSLTIAVIAILAAAAMAESDVQRFLTCSDSGCTNCTYAMPDFDRLDGDCFSRSGMSVKVTCRNDDHVQEYTTAVYATSDCSGSVGYEATGKLGCHGANGAYTRITCGASAASVVVVAVVIVAALFF